MYDMVSLSGVLYNVLSDSVYCYSVVAFTKFSMIVTDCDIFDSLVIHIELLG